MKKTITFTTYTRTTKTIEADLMEETTYVDNIETGNLWAIFPFFEDTEDEEGSNPLLGYSYIRVDNVSDIIENGLILLGEIEKLYNRDDPTDKEIANLIVEEIDEYKIIDRERFAEEFNLIVKKCKDLLNEPKTTD